MRATEHFVNTHDPKTLTVRQVMENDVYTVSPDTKGIDIAETLTDQNFGAVPVVGKDFALLGLVSEFDLLRAMEEGKDLRQIAAEEIMTRSVVTVTEETLVTDLTRLLQDRHLIRAPVVRGRVLVGIASRRDVLFGYLKATAKYWWPGKGSSG